MAGAVPAPERHGAGIAFAASGVFLFVCADAAIKGFSADYHAVMIAWFSGLFGAVSSTALGVRGFGVRALRTRHPVAQIARGLLISGSMVSAFLALKFMPLADVSAVHYSTPLFVAALAVPLLRERLTRAQVAALAVGFAGVMLIAQPGAGVFRPAALLAIASAFLYAIAMIITRRLRADETAAATMAWSHGTVVAVTSLALPWFWAAPPALDVALLVLLGLVNGVAHYCVMQAYRLAPAARVAPFDYTALAWATLFGFVFWGDFPATGVWIGVVLIVATTLYLSRARA